MKTKNLFRYKKLLNKLQKFLDLATLVFVIGLIFTVIYHRNSLIKVFGFEFNIVQSRSMEPGIKKYDFVIIAKTNPQNLKKGDIIAFYQQNSSIKLLHRIDKIENVSNNRLFVTKGDANKTADYYKKSHDEVYAKHVLTIPYVGILITFLLSKYGIMVVLLNLVNLMLVMFILNVEKQRAFYHGEAFIKVKTKSYQNQKNVNILNIY